MTNPAPDPATEPAGPRRVHVLHDAAEGDRPALEALLAQLGPVTAGMTVQDAREAEATPATDEAEVLIVVVGLESWRRASIDAALAEVLARTPPLGVLGLLLPDYDYPSLKLRATVGDDMLHATNPRDGRYWAHNVPVRLFENVNAGYAVMRPWSRRPGPFAEWIEAAAQGRNRKPAAVRPAATADDTSALGWRLASVRTLEPEVRIEGDA